VSVSVAAVAAALALVAGCRSTETTAGAPAATSAARATAAPHAVRYRLTWAQDDVVPVGQDGAWEVDSSLGYRVRVTRGWVTSYSTELVECPRAAAASGALGVFFPADAVAGHNAGTPNPAAVKPMLVESLTKPVAEDAGTVSLAPQAYCQLHYLVARAGRESPGLPADVDMVDASLHVEGTYRAPNATTDAAFAVHTASAYGQLFARVAEPPGALRADPGTGALVVEIRRRRSRLFDGVDFLRMPAKSVGLRMLQALVDGAEVTVRRDDGGR
jgi:hypothetical protein